MSFKLLCLRIVLHLTNQWIEEFKTTSGCLLSICIYHSFREKCCVVFSLYLHLCLRFIKEHISNMNVILKYYAWCYKPDIKSLASTVIGNMCASIKNVGLMQHCNGMFPANEQDDNSWQLLFKQSTRLIILLQQSTKNLQFSLNLSVGTSIQKLIS